MIQFFKQLKALIVSWWGDFTLQTRLMAGATLMVSLIMSGLTFWAVNTIQQDARINDTRFGRDLGLLLAANAAPLVEKHELTELARFSYSFIKGTSSVRYMLYADETGDIFFGIPYSEASVQNSLSLRRRMQLPADYVKNVDLPMVRQHITPAGEVTDVFVPLNADGRYLGVLALGINPNPTVVASSHLTRDVTIAVFVSIWVMVILGAVFNALTITQPIKELLVGVKNIAAGNFKQTIDLPLGGELGELIQSFNVMAERLERYEEQNIEELTAEKAKLESLVATIADGAILLDADMHVVLSNTASRRIFGWDPQANLDGNILQHLPSEVCSQVTRPLYQAARGDSSESMQFRIALSEPNSRIIRVLLNSVFDQSRENVKGIAITVQDITREVALNEAKSQFISNVSHELRTPLFNIKSFIETLHEYGEELSEPERREFLETANYETDRLTRLVNDVLDLSRLESNRRYQFSALDVQPTIEQTLRTYQLNARDKGIALEQSIEADLPSILGNYDLLLQVLANLVGNGLKFTPAGGRVMIRAYRSPAPAHPPHLAESVRIEVGDSGHGIAIEDQESVFDRFFRVENRVHTLEGTGLGLSIVKNIIDKHNSQVHLVSEVGIGTTFWFDLIVYEDPAVHIVELEPTLAETPTDTTLPAFDTSSDNQPSETENLSTVETSL
ncbi:MAG: ATP-binding protein [Cyanobacteria bacterium P01_A01_bin.114]